MAGPPPLTSSTVGARSCMCQLALRYFESSVSNYSATPRNNQEDLLLTASGHLHWVKRQPCCCISHIFHCSIHCHSLSLVTQAVTIAAVRTFKWPLYRTFHIAFSHSLSNIHASSRKVSSENSAALAYSNCTTQTVYNIK